MRRRLIALLLVTELILCGFGVGAAARAQSVDPIAFLRTTEFSVDGEGDAEAIVPIHDFVAGQAEVRELQAFVSPNPAPGVAPFAVLSNPTWEHFPLIVVVEQWSEDGDWLYVRLPMRPNGSRGWIRASDIRTWHVPNRIVVSRAANTLTVYRGDSDEVLFSAIVATGKPSTPTPAGDFFVDIVNPLGHDRTYGWGQMSVSGFSEVYESFGGGIGQMSLHGWNDNSVMGRNVSNGCVRMRNEDIAHVATLAPLGTPVSIID